MKRKTHNLNYLILAVSLLFSYSINAQWTQKGNDIDGDVVGEWSGSSVSMSSDGNTVAIGAPFNGGTALMAGRVRIFKLDKTGWTQKGNDIDGKAERDWLGASVSMSADGNTVAIGADGNDDGGLDAGYVRIFEWKETKWEQKGDNINGPERSQSGWSVSMSSDGNIVAIGAPVNRSSTTGTDEGHVRIYEWKETTWEQKGGYIKAEREQDFFGGSVSMSSDGNTVAIGAYSNGEVGRDAGHVRIHVWDGSAWIQKGNDIDGEAAGDNCGHSVSMSSDGKIVAIGARKNDGSGEEAGHVRVFEWDGTGAAWVQKGNDIDGEAADDLFGRSVSMSSDGNIVAIGAIQNDGSGVNAGHVRIHIWDGSAWTQKGIDIDGEAGGDYFGHSVSMSSDGNIVAIGALKNDGLGANAGHVRVFSFGPDVFSIEEKEKELSLSVYPNPTKGELHIELAEKGTCKIFSMIGQKVIKSIPLQKGRTTVDVSGINQGWYMLQIVSLKGKVRKNIKFRKE